jgi:hypothetical protein
MADATGKGFISYRRSRAAEAALLVAAQHDHGIPTWQDVKNLEEVPTGDALHEVLGNPFTASALQGIPPEVKDSDIIRKIEVPSILKRANKKDGFFLVPVCAGGTTYQTACSAVDRQLSADVSSDWNLPKLACDPISEADAAASQPSNEAKAACGSRPNRTRRALQAASRAWQEHLLPALAEIVRSLQATGWKPADCSEGRCSAHD